MLGSKGSGRGRQLGLMSCESRRDPREPGNKGCRWAGSHQEQWGEPGARLREFLLPQPVGVVLHVQASQTVVISQKQPQIILPEIRPIKRITGVSKYSKSPTLKISHEEAVLSDIKFCSKAIILEK